MKLKTLKDLEIVQDGHYYLQDLKQEAIKWVKSREIIACSEAEGIKAGKIKAIQNAVLKHINNITEEDLK